MSLSGSIVNNSSSNRLHSNVQLGFSVEYEDEDHKNFVGHNSPFWRDWDGGQLGGRPSWLQPRDLPKTPIVCRNCSTTQDGAAAPPMTFLCQLYAPADSDDVLHNNAFHRSLYVFGCSNINCAKEPIGSIRVLRAQLPRDNPFYPNSVARQSVEQQEEHEKSNHNKTDADAEDEEDEHATWAMHIPQAWDVALCKVCGQKSNGKCPIQCEEFCGKHHQKEYKKYVFDKKQSGQLLDEDEAYLPSLCAESELVVEEEPPSSGTHHATTTTTNRKTLFGKNKKDSNKDSDNDDDDDDDDDEDRQLEQEDLNDMTGAAAATVSKDSVTMAFYDRIKDRPNVQEQCLRYLRWPDEELAEEMDMPLWLSQDHQPNNNNNKNDIPDCPYCGAPRKFEFQLMPQMLHFLRNKKVNSTSTTNLQTEQVKKAVQTAASIMEQAPKEHIPPSFAEAKEKATDAIRTQLMEIHGTNELSWGVVAVYTCTASCGGMEETDSSTGGNGGELGAYREEFAWKQPSLD